MKKLLALMVTLLMVFGLVSFAVAEVTLSGDARVRGRSHGNFDHDSDTDADKRWYDHRIRLKIHGSNDDGAGVKVRLRLMNQDLNEAGMAAKADQITYGGDDYAYMYAKVAENWTFSGGWMPGDWGHRLWGWGASHQRVKIEGNLDGLILGYWNQKDLDTLGTPGPDNLKDVESNSVWVVAPLGEFTVGATIKMTKDARSGGLDGSEFDVFFTGNAGDISLKGELAQIDGDINVGVGGDAQMGAFIGGGMDMDGLNVSGAIAMTSNGYVANGYFTPALLFGTSQPTAAVNLGENLIGGTGDTTAIVLGVDTKLSDEMGVGAKVLYAMWDNYVPDDGNGGTFMELDATFSYALGENTSFGAGLAYGMPSFDDSNVPDDSMMAIAWTLGTSF